MKVLDVQITLIVLIVSSCIHRSNHRVVHLKHIQFLYLSKAGGGGQSTHPHCGLDPEEIFNIERA